MADYRELLRKALDALPENTGANRRAVYEKARTALVAQLRAIEPPLPAREITTHRLALEDCIREVEHEATEKLLGRFRAVEDAPVEEYAPEPAAPVVEEPAPFERFEPEIEDVAESEDEPAFEPVVIAEEPQQDLSEDADDRIASAEVVDTWPVTEFEPEPRGDENIAEPVADWSPEDTQDAVDANEPVFSEPVVDEPGTDATDMVSSTPEEDRIARLISGEADFGASTADDAPEDTTPKGGDTSYAMGSIEDIIASAERATPKADEPSSKSDDNDHRVIPFVSPARMSDTAETAASEKHFLLSEADASKTSPTPLVDVHGRPLVGATLSAAPGTAMSSVREVDLEPGILNAPEVSDAQVAIDRAIAALDREAQGEHSEDSAKETAAQADAAPAPAETDVPAQDTPSGSGPGALTIFLVISVLLLGGGGVAGFWAWREGYIDLNTVFAQGDTQPATEVAVADPGTDTFEDAVPPAGQTTAPATNTTPDVPATSDGVPATLPGEQTPSTETVTPSTTPTEPEVAFEDRLPAEADTNGAPSEEMLEEPSVALATEGAQSLLLEEQSGQTTGAVPYSGSVEWSRGTDELGNPTIVADASIPARNLDVEVLIRRNADANLPASHLMEVNFTVAETFVGGSIANLPGVLLKDQELVQGQPLTGASARIVGNSFLFALSSASDIDVENNIALLSDRGWLDLAMVYGTGRRAIMTLEKGEEGQAIFEDVMAAWSELDAAAAGGVDSNAAEASDAGA